MIATAAPRTTTKAPPKYEGCGHPRPADAAPVGCPACDAERKRHAKQQARLKREAEVRRLLGTEPFDRATNLARVALLSAAEVIEAGRPYATSHDRADALHRAAHHVAAATRAIEAATAPAAAWVPSWPAP
jgi:hypothetical protein